MKSLSDVWELIRFIGKAIEMLFYFCVWDGLVRWLKWIEAKKQKTMGDP